VSYIISTRYYKWKSTFYAFKNELIKLKKFKRNYSNFRKSLLSQNKILNPNIEDYVINPYGERGRIHLTVITNLFCGYCSEVHSQIERVLEKYHDVTVDYVFNISFEEEESGKISLYETLIQKYLDNNHPGFKNELRQIYETDNKSVLGFDQKKTGINIKVQRILKKHKTICQDLNINYTPQIFLNYRYFPQAYEIEDLVYFIPDLLNDTI
jgi:protein-disulfide isomerase